MRLIQSPITVQKWGKRIDLSLHTDFFFHLKREIKHRYQRATRGYSYADTWSFDGTLATYLCGALTEFKRSTVGHPMQMTMKQWEATLDEMKEGFCYYMEHEDDLISGEEWRERYDAHEKCIEEKLNRSFKLLRKHFQSLWW